MLSDSPAVAVAGPVPDCAFAKPVMPNWVAPTATTAFAKKRRRLLPPSSDVFVFSNGFVIFLFAFDSFEISF
jgi:hypothetical protein